MEIVVSKKVEKKLAELAKNYGKDVSLFAGELLEERVEHDFPEMIDDEEEILKPNPLMTFAGIFSSKGDGKTSENYKKILLDEVDKLQGFGKD
jgi:hypothetical protein